MERLVTVRHTISRPIMECKERNRFGHFWHHHGGRLIAAMLWQDMASEPTFKVEDLDCKAQSKLLHDYNASELQAMDPTTLHHYEGHIQQLLCFTDTLIEQGHTLNGEIDAILLDDQGILLMSDGQKKRFLVLMTQFIFIFHQALLVFPELLRGQAIQFGGQSIAGWFLQHDLLDIDSLLMQCVLLNRQNFLACTKVLQVEEGAWVRPKGRVYFYKFFLELYNNGMWQEIMKMSQQTFFWLCDRMAPHIKKSDTNYRQAIPVPCRLAACIYKLATGCRSAEIMGKFGIGRSTLYSILRQVIPGIIEVLGGCIAWPAGQHLERTQRGIQEICSFPHCAGVVGGCDIPIVAPSEDPWAFMNASQEYSVVLQAVCDHERKFTSVNVGKVGSMEYSGVLRSSSLFERASSEALLNKGQYTLPCGSQLSSYLLGDSGYPCLDWLMTPFRESPGGFVGPMQVNYNEKLLLGKSLVDESFAILKSTFAELAAPCLLDIELVPEMIGACCVLHNILITRKDILVDNLDFRNAQRILDREQELASFENEGDVLEENQEALFKRDTLAYYLMSLQCDDNGELDSSSPLLELDDGFICSSNQPEQLGDSLQVSSSNLPELQDDMTCESSSNLHLDNHVMDLEDGIILTLHPL